MWSTTVPVVKAGDNGWRMGSFPGPLSPNREFPRSNAIGRQAVSTIGATMSGAGTRLQLDLHEFSPSTEIHLNSCKSSYQCVARLVEVPQTGPRPPGHVPRAECVATSSGR